MRPRSRLRAKGRVCSPFSDGEGAERERPVRRVRRVPVRLRRVRIAACGGRWRRCWRCPSRPAASARRWPSAGCGSALKLDRLLGRRQLRLASSGWRPRRASWRFPGRPWRRPARTICRIRRSPSSVPRPRAHRTPRLYWLSAMPCCAALRNHFTAVGIVRLAVDAFGIEHGEVMHGLGIAAGGGGEIEPAGGGQVLLHALALLQHAGIAELRRRQALARRALEPARRLSGWPARRALPRSAGHLVFGGGVAGDRRAAQLGAADGERQRSAPASARRTGAGLAGGVTLCAIDPVMSPGRGRRAGRAVKEDGASARADGPAERRLRADRGRRPAAMLAVARRQPGLRSIGG